MIQTMQEYVAVPQVQFTNWAAHVPGPDWYEQPVAPLLVQREAPVQYAAPPTTVYEHPTESLDGISKAEMEIKAVGAETESLEGISKAEMEIKAVEAKMSKETMQRTESLEGISQAEMEIKAMEAKMSEETMQKSDEMPQVQFNDRVVNVPGQKHIQVPAVQTVQKVVDSAGPFHWLD